MQLAHKIISSILTNLNGHFYSNADKNTAYNLMPSYEQTCRLLQFVVGNEHYDFNGLPNGISIGPAAFLAFMTKTFRPLILSENLITYLVGVFIQSQTK